jgi:hypothetical protein
MTATQFSKVLFVQAMEESDPHGHHLSFATRHHATQQARETQASFPPSSPQNGEDFLIRRTDIIWSFAQQAFPASTKTWENLQMHVPVIFVAIPALILGILINGLGTSQRINLLNFPLLLLVFWNAGIYLGILATAGIKGTRFTPRWEPLVTWLSKIAALGKSKTWQPFKKTDTSTAQWLHRATTRYLTLVWTQIGPIWKQDIRLRLHLGSACLAIGIVISMYVRGLVLDYQATWESTFLTPSHVHTFLQTVLGPAAWLLRYDFPTVPDIAALQSPGHGPAAPWIHLWAITTLAIIIMPRGLLALAGQRTANQSRRSLTIPLHDPYFLHVLAPDRGQGLQVTILPYSYQPSAHARNFLENCFLDLFGNQAILHWHEPLPFGETSPTWPRDSSPAQTLVLLFHAGQTPELEVHGELLHTLQAHRTPSNQPWPLLLLLDQEPYRQAMDTARLLERRRTWERLATQYHLHIVAFDPQSTDPTQLIHQAHEGLKTANR